jgi:hypothetical protein
MPFSLTLEAKAGSLAGLKGTSPTWRRSKRDRVGHHLGGAPVARITVIR